MENIGSLRLPQRIGRSIYGIVRQARQALEATRRTFTAQRGRSSRSEREAASLLVQHCLKKALYVIHALEVRAPRLWAKEAPAGLCGPNGMIQLVTDWLQGASIPFSVLEEQRVTFAEAVETVRHAQVGLDGEPLTRDSDHTHPERAIGGLVGSATLIMVTAISCIELPEGEGRTPPPHEVPHLLRDKMSFAERELQQALDRLVELEALQRNPLIPSFGSFQGLLLGGERLSLI